MESSPTLAAPETVAATLRTILRGLLAMLGGWGLGPARAVLLYRRTAGIALRIERMLTRFRAGRLWRMPPRAGRIGAIRKPNCTLPRGFGWLVKAGGHQAAGFGSQLQHLLHQPEMADLLAASPQAGRILRPLCRALAVELPAIGAMARAATVGQRRKRKPRPKPEPFRIPLPRGVLTAARRAGFGKDR